MAGIAIGVGVGFTPLAAVEPAAYRVTLTGLTGGEARQGDAIGVTITPEPDPGSIVTYQWTQDGDDIPGATTDAETVAIETDHTDNGALRCVVTIDGEPFQSNAAPMRYAPGTFGALSDQIFTSNTGVQTYTFDAATGANLTWTYSLVGSQAGITLDSATRTISFDTDALEVQTDAIVQVAAADQYGKPAAGSPRTMLSSIWNAPTTVVADGTDTYIGPYTIGEVLTRHGEWEANIGQVSLEHVHLDWYSGGHTGALQDFNVASPDLGGVSLTSLIQTLYDRGTLTVVSWYPLAIDSTDLGWFDGTNTIPPIIEEILDGTHDAYLRTCAQQIAALDVPVMMGLFGEVDSIAVLFYGPNGTTAAGVPPADFTGEFGDPTILDGPERVAAAYRHVIGIFKEERADKVSWMIYTSSEFDPVGSPPEWFYPGDAYIDWIGQSLYLTDPADTADSVLKAGYDAWVSAAPGKPFIIPEFGIDGNAAPMNRDTAYTTVLTELANNTEFPELAAITVANSDNFVANNNLPLLTSAEYAALVAASGYELGAVTTDPATAWPNALEITDEGDGTLSIDWAGTLSSITVGGGGDFDGTYTAFHDGTALIDTHLSGVAGRALEILPPTGTPEPGQTLTAGAALVLYAEGQVEPAVAVTGWERDGVAIPGASGETYTLTVADDGAEVRPVYAITAAGLATVIESGPVVAVAAASGAAINSITGSVGTIDVDHTGTLTVTGGVGTIDLEVA